MSAPKYIALLIVLRDDSIFTSLDVCTLRYYPGKIVIICLIIYNNFEIIKYNAICMGIINCWGLG